ncbi:hypothetical protein AWZ03_012305 [Drosophila navojoa]|uniref:Uncharacterized protein n=1 Tax=Drosophila navojoa TaxID=7232 RepID=A0A484B0C7_DRONA|nr:hypothetical protein AWZ03_012305 [Drosophila navojoa]
MDAEEETLRNERRLNALLTIHRQLTDLLEFVNRIGVSLETLSISTVRFIADQNLQAIQGTNETTEGAESETKGVGESDTQKWAKRS